MAEKQSPCVPVVSLWKKEWSILYDIAINKCDVKQLFKNKI
jgi:hypothetical protein